MRYFMKFYLDCSIGTVELVEDSITLLNGNDERGTFHWIEVFDKQDLYKARREGWEQAKREAIDICVNGFKRGLGDKFQGDVFADAIAAMEYKEAQDDK